jgi:hypothetical protein
MLTLALILSAYCLAINTLQIPLLPPWSSYQYLDGLGMVRYLGNQDQDIGKQPQVQNVKISIDTLSRLLKVARNKGKVTKDPEYTKQPARKISNDLANHLRRPRKDENEELVDKLNGMPLFGQELRKASGDTF